jgi:hypothetical protein
MTPLVIPGAWSVAARPGGSFVACVAGSHVITGWGRVELPRGQNLLYADLARDGVRVLGVGHQDDRAWLWDGREWKDRGPAFGPRAVIFDGQDQPLIVRGPGTETGSQGWRYIADDGRPVSSDSTYEDLVRRIWEHTTHGGITIGQGGKGPLGEDPCIAILPDGSYRLIEEGQCRFIDFEREGGRLSVAYIRQDIGAARVWFLTVDELKQFPRYTPPPADVPPVVVIPPVVVPPKPEPKPVDIPNRIEVVRRVIAANPGPKTHEHLGRLTEIVVNELAADDPNWGHVGKAPGRTQYRGHAIDAIMYRPRPDAAIDIIAGAKDPNRPIEAAWGETESGGQPWMAPIAVEGAEPKPEPGGDSLAARVELLEASIAGAMAEIGSVRDELRAAVSELRAAQDDDHIAVDVLKRALSNLAERAARHGDPVEVEGSIGLGAALKGARVKWSGKVL